MKRPLLAVGLMALVTTARPIVRVRDPLPSALSDAEFWRLVTTLSEPTGTFPSENFASNELDYVPIVAALEQRPHGGAYLGVGPEQNFTYIAAVRPQIAFIVDIRRQAMIQQLLFKALFELSSDRADFISKLFAKPRPAGVDTSSSIRQLWDAYWYVRSDSALYFETRAAIERVLMTTHRFALDSADRATLEHLYAAFFTFGPIISYGGDRQDGNSVGPVPAGPTPAGGFGVAASPWHAVPLLSSSDGRSSPVQIVEGCIGRILPGARCTVNRSISVQVTQSALPLVSLYGGPNFATVTMATDAHDTARSFLATEARFRYVKDFEAKNLLVPVVGDFVGPTAIRAVGTYLAGHAVTVNAFYVSNVEQYVWGTHATPPDQHRLFYANVASLPLDSASVFIRPLGVSIPGSPHDAALARGRTRSPHDSAAVRATIFTASVPANARALARRDSATERVTISLPPGAALPANGLRSKALVGASLCPILLFLGALRSGEIGNELDVERCLR